MATCFLFDLSDPSKDMIHKVKQVAHQICILHGRASYLHTVNETKQAVDRCQFFAGMLQEFAEFNL